MAGASVGRVKLQLITQDQSIALPDGTGPILADTKFRRVDLSRLVNGLREATQPPLEFLINGQFLRSSLDDFLTTNGISAETLLIVEYVRATVPPIHIASYQHDDWVSAVDVLSRSSFPSSDTSSAPLPGQERILSGCLDGHLRVWDTSNTVLATSAANETAVQGYRGIKTARWISPKSIVSGGYDQVVRIWNYTDSSLAENQGNQLVSTAIKPHIELYGHRHTILKVAARYGSDRVLSASADHSICVWSTKRSNAPAADEKLVPARTNKRQKLSSSGPAIQTAQRGPLLTLKAHTDQATGVAFHPQDETVAYSASYDRTMRTWDLVSGQLVDTRTLPSGQAINAMCPTRLSGGLVACGTMGRGTNIMLVDPRASATTTVAMSLKGHTNPISSIACDPASEYGLVSGSYDSTCRIWDLRNAKAAETGRTGESVYTIAREGKSKDAGDNKVLDICWDAQVGIVAGGEDTRLQINRSDNPGS